MDRDPTDCASLVSSLCFVLLLTTVGRVSNMLVHSANFAIILRCCFGYSGRIPDCSVPVFQ